MRRACAALLLHSHGASGLLIEAAAMALLWALGWAVPVELHGGFRGLGPAVGLLRAGVSLRHLCVLAKVRRDCHRLAPTGSPMCTSP